MDIGIINENGTSLRNTTSYQKTQSNLAIRKEDIKRLDLKAGDEVYIDHGMPYSCINIVKKLND